MSNTKMLIIAAVLLSGCAVPQGTERERPEISVNYGLRHTIEDYDVIRFKYTSINAEAEVSKATGVKVCERVSAFIGGEHDIAGDPYKIVSTGVNCSFGIGE